MAGEKFYEKLFCQRIMTQRDEADVSADDTAKKLVEANDLIFQLQKNGGAKAQKIVEQSQTIRELQSTTASLSAQLQDANNSVENLKTSVALYIDTKTPTPDFLDEERPPYKPCMQFVNPDKSITSVTVENPRVMFEACELARQIVNSKEWRNLSSYQKRMVVWAFISNPNTRKYLGDYLDSWQTVLQTLIRKLGDCEDGSTLFVVLCRLLGILSDEVFLAVGPTSFGYHAYPISKLSEQDVKEMGMGTLPGWYIFESTLNGIPQHPKALLGSNYWIDDGLMNWEHAGQIKPDSLAQFNGKQTSLPGAAQGARIENTHKKRQTIQDAWEKDGHVKKQRR